MERTPSSFQTTACRSLPLKTPLSRYVLSFLSCGNQEQHGGTQVVKLLFETGVLALTSSLSGFYRCGATDHGGCVPCEWWQWATSWNLLERRGQFSQNTEHVAPPQRQPRHLSGKLVNHSSFDEECVLLQVSTANMPEAWGTSLSALPVGQWTHLALASRGDGMLILCVSNRPLPAPFMLDSPSVILQPPCKTLAN
eukprot:2312395-Pyramimonas_sp.AAC.1